MCKDKMNLKFTVLHCRRVHLLYGSQVIIVQFVSQASLAFTYNSERGLSVRHRNSRIVF